MRTLTSVSSAVLLISLTLFLFACGGGGPNNAKYQIAVIPKSVSLDFWNTVQTGAQAAASKLDSVNVIWKGTSSETNVAGQIRIVESFINRGVDAIVIAAADSRGLVPALREAKKNGLDVVTIDSNTKPQVSTSFISTDNVAGAEKAADLVAEMTGGEGQVALIPYIAGASTSNKRERGFRQGLKQYSGLDLVTTQYSQSDYSQAMTVTEDILTSYPNLDAIFAANEPSAVGAAQAIKSRGVSEQVLLVGFDASPREIKALRSGAIDGLIVQNPFRMGYEGVTRAYQVLRGKRVPKRINSGSRVVTQKNLDKFLSRRKKRKNGEYTPNLDTSQTRTDTSRARPTTDSK